MNVTKSIHVKIVTKQLPEEQRFEYDCTNIDVSRALGSRRRSIVDSIVMDSAQSSTCLNMIELKSLQIVHCATHMSSIGSKHGVIYYKT